MLFGPDNFLTFIKDLVTGGGRDSNDNAAADAGFLKKDEGISLATLRPILNIASITDNTGGTVSTTIANTAGANPTTAEFENAIASIVAQLNSITNHLKGTADETNASVLKVEETVDNIGTIRFVVPRDYDEATDELKMRVLASQITVSTDNDVELDAQVYVKTAGSALGSDVGPAAPGTVLSTTEQWVEFDFTGLSLERDDVVYIKLITNGANDTDGEEILIHDLELVYRSTLVSYDQENSSNVPLR